MKTKTELTLKHPDVKKIHFRNTYEKSEMIGQKCLKILFKPIGISGIKKKKRDEFRIIRTTPL